MKAIRIILIMVLVLICFLVNIFFVFSEDDEIYTYDEFSYRINANNDVIIVSFGYDLNKIIDKVVIPNEIDGRKVVGTDKSIFYSSKGMYQYSHKIKKIVCSNYMETVDMRSFDGAESLETLILGKYTKRYTFEYLHQSHDSVLTGFTIKCPADAVYLKTVKGALYSKDRKILYRCPKRGNRTGFKVSKYTQQIDRYAISGYGYRTLQLGSKIRVIKKGAIQYSSINKIKIPKKCYKKYLRILKKSGITKSI